MHATLRQMETRGHCPCLLAAPVLALLLLTTGCSGSMWVWPTTYFSSRTKTTFVTPAQQIEQLQELAENRGANTGEGQDQIVARLAGQLKSEADPLVREQVVRTLQAFPTAQSVFVLESALADAQTEVRIAACQGLAHLKYIEAQAALVGALQKDDNIDVRLAAADALGNFAVQQSIDALAAVLDDRDPALQYRAMQSLRKITGEDFGNRVDAWRMYVRGETPPPPEPVSMARRLRELSPF